MKNIFVLFFLMSYSISFSQEYFMHDYRMIPEDEIDNYIENEKHFWSKVAQNLVKEGKITGWAMLKREGGSSKEPNFYIYVGIGKRNNLKYEHTSTFLDGAEKLLKSIDKDSAVLVRRSLNIDSHSVYSVILERTNFELNPNSTYNYLKINYCKVNGNIAEFSSMQKNIWGDFIKKSMIEGNGSQTLWSTAKKISPKGNGYNWNFITIDGYLNYQDLLVPNWKDSTKFPEAGIDKINSMMLGGGFYKQVVWKILMSINSRGEFKVHSSTNPQK
tara:strand:- start:1913 stop:2731 length:819 start_codon:yes stop_codon:yes gene_type:complete